MIHFRSVLISVLVLSLFVVGPMMRLAPLAYADIIQCGTPAVPCDTAQNKACVAGQCVERQPADESGGLTNPLNNVKTLEEFLTKILDALVILGSILLTLAIVYVGFLFVVAQGNEEKIRSARGALMWTVIGGLILLGAKAISLVIQDTVKAL